MKNLSTTSSSPRLSGLLLTLSCAWAIACGGPSTPPASPVPDQANDAPAVANDSSGPTMSTGYVEPQIPSSPAAPPANLMAELILSNPNAQLTQLGLFADGVQPGMGAFITPVTFMQMLGGVNGAQGLSGVDLNGPLYVIVLDMEKVVVVATMASEAELRSSLEGGRVTVVTHEGFAAIGSEDALTAIAPYALSNLVDQPTTNFPTLNLHVEKIMQSSQGEMMRGMVREQLDRAGSGETATDTLLEVMGNVGLVRTSLEANQSGATLHVSTEILGGPVKAFLGKQQPSDFSMMERVGTGPWGIAAAGRLDFSVFAPLLVALGEAEANPVLTQIAAQLPALAGEMAFGLNMPKKPEFVMGLQLQDPKGIAQVVDTLMALVSKQKNQDLDGMPATIKLASIKTRAGSLHELRAKPTSKHQIELYGKKNVSGFFGVAVNSLITTFGHNAQQHAKTLSAASGKIAGKGAKLSAALELAKSARESFVLAIDSMSLTGERPAKDVEPLVLGIGFDANTVRARIVVPMEHVKEASKLGLF